MKFAVAEKMYIDEIESGQKMIKTLVSQIASLILLNLNSSDEKVKTEAKKIAVIFSELVLDIVPEKNK